MIQHGSTKVCQSCVATCFLIPWNMLASSFVSNMETCPKPWIHIFSIMTKPNPLPVASTCHQAHELCTPQVVLDLPRCWVPGLISVVFFSTGKSEFSPRTWLCITHFQRYLKSIFKAVNLRPISQLKSRFQTQFCII